jgi:hypothetical protein
MLLKTRVSLICGNSLAAAAAGPLLVLALGAAGQTCAPSGEIVSNNMQYCAGSGDTLWIASFRQGWGLNYTVNQGAAWGGYTLGCYPDAEMAGLVFGGGIAAAILNPLIDAYGRTGPTTVWHFSLAASRAAAFSIAWPDSVQSDTSVKVQARGGAFVAGKFYLACGHGGLLVWDPAADSLRAFLFRDTGSFVPSAFNRARHTGFGTDTTEVLSVDRFADTAVLAATGPRILLFNTARQTWDTAITSAFADTGVHLEGFAGAFVNNAVQQPLIYAYVTYRAAGIRCFSLFRYCSPQKRWCLALSNQPTAAAPAPRGFLYVLSDTNVVRVYRDTVPDTGAVVPGPLKVVETPEEFDARLLMGMSIAKPGAINDLTFLKSSDSSGSLCLVSSDGFFVSWDESIGDTAVTGVFALIKRARVIKNGLAETYALPGIITDDPRWSPTTVFVYKLARDAGITIRIYDYNMQYVKSIVENAPRKAAAALGRSTDSRSDVWDGTAASGRPVAPGVYYYKITATTGERSFGKIVVAKGRGN